MGRLSYATDCVQNQIIIEVDGGLFLPFYLPSPATGVDVWLAAAAVCCHARYAKAGSAARVALVAVAVKETFSSPSPLSPIITLHHTTITSPQFPFITTTRVPSPATRTHLFPCAIC